jgi:toxin ParE1/3/4
MTKIDRLCHPADDPPIGSPRRFASSRLEGLRLWPVRGFRRHLLFFRPMADDEGVEVLRLLHAARDIESLLEP